VPVEKESRKIPSIKSLSERIEEIFCSSLYGDDENKRECKLLMKARRKKKLGKEELLAKLGLSEEAFQAKLRKATEEALDRA